MNRVIASLSCTGLAALCLLAGLTSGCNDNAYCFRDCTEKLGAADGGDGGLVDGPTGSEGSLFDTPLDFNPLNESGGGDGPAEGCVKTNGGIEICDNLDNDCNGTVDDSFDMQDPRHCGTCENNCLTKLANVEPTSITCDWKADAGTAGTCKFTACTSDWYDIDKNPDNGCEYPCVKTANDDTKCNNRDDDCDGVKDEDVDLCASTDHCGKCGGTCVVLHGTPTCDHPATPPCDSSNTHCEILSCDKDWWDLDTSYASGCEYNCTPTNNGVEVCGDGVDNDCDGKIDGADPDVTIDPALGTQCFGDPDGVCASTAHAGTWICVGQKAVCTGADILVQGQLPEICDGLDNDCDGIIDNKLTDVGAACGVSGVFPCKLGSQQCVGGALQCVGAIGPGVEFCNGLDDDCNGTIDDNPSDAVGLCGAANSGECKFGNKVCVGGVIQCQGNLDPKFETCNGKDDDCDGTVDNNLTDVGASCGASGISPCKKGTIQCQGGVVNCVGVINPTLEACNGIDDDCNGTIDDNVPGAGVSCGQSDVYPCKKGAIQCQGGAMVCAGALDPKVEVCNGIDDNCDGLIDNNTTDSGDSCGQSDTAPCVKGTVKCENGALACIGALNPSPELCNKIDDDCNGTVDDNVNGMNADCGTSATLPCKLGKTQCVNGVATCVGKVDPAVELCNGIDDNCNGTVDDGTTDTGGTCGLSNSAPCTFGQWQCKNATKVCVGAINPAPETCNGVDDDCNGQIDDNAPDAQGSCGLSSVGACKLGNRACIGGVVQCLGNVDPKLESCNNVDDDCDGTVDNNLTDVGTSCGKSGTSPCKLGTIQCQNGVKSCVGAIDPGAETCNGLDDDCSGVVDDNVPGTGVVCGLSSTFPCKQGSIQCQGGAMICVGAIDPKTETCNGIDDNCDGLIDNSTIDSGGSCGQSAVLPCKKGVVQCQNGQLACAGAIDPKPETCNGIDDDCNGTIDNNVNGIGADCGTSNTAPCKYGKTSCQGGAVVCVGALNPKPELCNGIDDNCNGTVDDATTDTGTPCGVSNVSPCALGLVQCQGAAKVCVGNVDPKPELCNGIDDNCNGTIDDNATDATGTCGQSSVGACKLGNKACTGGIVQCIGNVDPKLETCNSVDDDCDGSVDNNLTDVGASCGQSNTSPCKMGKIQCQAGTKTCVGAVNPAAETCDGLDNDCNGTIDDNTPGAGVACGLSNTFPCKKGAMQCQGGAMVCVGFVDPKPETCNGIDDNCDGTIDNNAAGTNVDCGANNTAPCKFGKTQCQAGAIICVGNVDPKPETCNGIDDNCNGTIDDNAAGVNADCGPNNTLPCKFGKTACQSGAIVCVGNVDPKSETCNGVDDNCNGTVDDNPSGVGVACGASNSAPCRFGVTQCAAGAISCVGKVDPKPETCNGIDDNCNTQVDDSPTDPGLGQPCDVPPTPPSGITTPCKAGTRVCQGGSVICQGSVKPVAGAQDQCGDDTNCDGVHPADNLTTDVHHCGNCATDCLVGAVHANWACVAGACTFQGCQTGYWDNGGPGDAVAGDKKCGYACTFISAQELCNGQDDNCNGLVDDAVLLPTAVQACGVSPSASSPECTTGVTVGCTGGAVKCTFSTPGVCSAAGGCSVTAEICDAYDNNCNGLLNENTTNYGKPCASDDAAPGTHGACRTTGTFVCSGPNATTCSAVKADCNSLPGGCTELCDGVDNDCDGVVDETFNAKGTNAANFVKPTATKISATRWMYSYEASRPLATTTTPGTGNGYFTSAPAGTTLDKTRSCSVAGKIPWFNVTGTESDQVCTAMGGFTCAPADWQTACQATVPCTWGYNPRTGGACTTSYVAGTKYCNLGPSYDFNGTLGGDQDGLLPTASGLLGNCGADWSALQGNTAATNRIFDITGNLREITRISATQYNLLGGAFNTSSEAGATCTFTFYVVDQNFKFFDTGFRCCFSADPTL
jgi:hypothetical protein